MKTTAALLLILTLCGTASAQFAEYPLPRPAIKKPVGKASRTQAVEDPTFLPFWDDFSSSDTVIRDTLWLYGQSVLLNNGTGIRPPSRNVVTFDGADSLGKPYNINDVLAKGFADQLVSQPIRMDLVAPIDRGTVYISFFYQLQGNGEPPDPGDQLVLAFKADDGTWETVFTVETGPSLASDVFQQVILPVTDDRFFHDAFQFRFFNYARLSGPYDTWNVDYIYLNKGRSDTDLYYPDRTVSGSFTSLFSNYFAMPLKHFLQNVTANLTAPTVELYNLKAVDFPSGTPHIQPINYTTEARMSARVGGVTNTTLVELDSAQFPGFDLPGLTYMTVTLNTLPDSTDFDPAADSIYIHLRYGMSTKDNVPFALTGDYDPAVYSPIDFRYSDTLSADYVLSSYYAYDDGTAEYAAGLNQAGSYLAFLFNSQAAGADTLTYVDIYFPEFGDNTNQSLLLQIRSILNDITAPPLFEQLIVVNRKTRNEFVRYPFYRPVPVGATFYVGWKQISNASIPVGLDKNTDNGSRIYYSVNGDWVQNTLVKGSIMVRPGFGKGDGSTVTGAEKVVAAPSLYPNPNRGMCTVNARTEMVEAYDLAGRRLELGLEHFDEETRIHFPTGTQGLVIVRIAVAGRYYTRKVMVLAEGRQ